MNDFQIKNLISKTINFIIKNNKIQSSYLNNKKKFRIYIKANCTFIEFLWSTEKYGDKRRFDDQTNLLFSMLNLIIFRSISTFFSKIKDSYIKDILYIIFIKINL